MPESTLWLVRLGDSLLTGLGDLVLLWLLLGVLRIRMVRLRAALYLLAVAHCVLAFVTGSPFGFLHLSVTHDGTGPWYPWVLALDPLWVWAWLSVVAWLALRRVGATVRTHRFLHAIRRLAPPGADTRARRSLHGVARELDVVAPPLVELDGPFATPFVIGWREPLLVLPRTVTAGLDDDELRAVLAHELAHVERRDLFMQLVLEAIATVFFFHWPLLRLLGHYRAEVEKDCDGRASALCGQPGPMASALVKVLELADGAPTPRCAASTLLRPRVRQTVKRLRHLRALQRRRFPVFRVLQVAILLFVFPWQPTLRHESMEMSYDPAAGGPERSSRVVIAIGFTSNPFNRELLGPLWEQLLEGLVEEQAARAERARGDS